MCSYIKYLYILFLIFCTTILLYGCSSDGIDEEIPQEPELPEHIVADIPSADQATDMVLIYHGYHTRPAWTSEDMKYYIYRENEGKVEWLFDGFLFLELYANINGVEYDYGIANEANGKVAPRKLEWEDLLQKTFAEGKGPDAIEATIDSLVQTGVQPPYKRKAMFALPNPQVLCKDWGILNHKTMDFTNNEDRLDAVKWYVGRILEEWKKKEYKYVDLAGFYWLHEQLDTHSFVDKKVEDVELVKNVSSYLNELGYPLTWIPYYGAAGADKWQEMGFNMAYQQPNYFFSIHSPISIITGAIDFARQHNMFLEMEFDERLLDGDPGQGASSSQFQERYYTYLAEFEKANAWNNFPIAYYEGGKAWLRMCTSRNAEAKAMVKALGDILVKRNGKFSKIKNN